MTAGINDVPGVPMPQVSVQGPLASAIADTLSLIQDFHVVQQCCARLEQMDAEHGDNGGDPTVRRALWAAAVIAYRRGLKGGKAHLVEGQPRKRISQERLESLGPELLSIHELVLDTANRHIAHRVSDLEQIQVSLVLAPPPQPQGVIGTAHQMLQYIGPEQSQLKGLAQIARRLEMDLQSDVVALKNQLRAEAATFNVDVLYSAAQTP